MREKAESAISTSDTAARLRKTPAGCRRYQDESLADRIKARWRRKAAATWIAWGVGMEYPSGAGGRDREAQG